MLPFPKPIIDTSVEPRRSGVEGLEQRPFISLGKLVGGAMAAILCCAALYGLWVVLP